jgi:hypothetical protein
MYPGVGGGCGCEPQHALGSGAVENRYGVDGWAEWQRQVIEDDRDSSRPARRPSENDPWDYFFPELRDAKPQWPNKKGS